MRELWPYALASLGAEQRATFAERASERLPFALPAEAEPVERGAHSETWPELWEEMTSVRRIGRRGRLVTFAAGRFARADLRPARACGRRWRRSPTPRSR